MKCESNDNGENSIPLDSKNLEIKRRFKCPQCDYPAQFLCVIRNHAVVHSTEPEKHTFSISGCNFRTNSPYSLKHHVRRRHEELLKPEGLRSWNFCTNCDFRTKELVVLKRHSMTHQETKPFACSFDGCSFRSHWQSSVYSHERRRHYSGSKKRFLCSSPQCDHGSFTMYDLGRHMVTHSNDRPFACFFPGCSYKAKQAKSVVDHQKVHDPTRVKDKECPFCSDKFFDDHSLTTHIKAHLDEKPYSCSYPNCNVRRVHESAIKAHEVTHRDETNVHCDQPGCNYRTKNKSRLGIHKKIHDPNRWKNVQCTLCAKTFYNESAMRMHMLSHTQEKPYKCPNCDYSASVPGRLKSHRCFRQNPQLHPQVMKMKYDCELCNYSTKHSRNVKEHMMNVHIARLDDAEDGTKRYRCRECEKVSGCFSTAKKHCHMHSQAKPFSCTFKDSCDFQARLIRQLQKHMREAHRAERVLPTTFCRECKREISFKNWNLHLKSHSSEPYNCLVCGYESRFPSRLFTHIQSKRHQKNVSSFASRKQ